MRYIYKFKLNQGNIKKNIKTYVAAITPCNILPMIYGFIEISVFEIMLNTWSSIEIP